MEYKDLVFLVLEPFYYWLFYNFVLPYKKKKISNVTLSILIILSLGISIVSFLKINIMIVNTSIAIMSCVIISFYLTDSIKISLLCSAIWTVIGMISEVVSVSLLMFVYNLNMSEVTEGDIMYTIAMFLSRSMWLALVVIQKRIVKVKYSSYFWYVFYVLLIGTVLLMHLSVKICNNNSETAPYLLGANGMVFLIDIIIVFLMDVIYKKESAEKDLIITNNYLKLQEVVYNKEKELREKEGIERHDFKNKIYLLKSYVNDNKIDELKKTLNDWESVNNDKKLISTGNEVLDIILNSKKATADKYDIKTNFSVDLKEILKIKDFDLVTILGNLLDNAIEAVAKIDEIEYRKIDCNIVYDKSVLKISINNPFEEPVKIKKNGLFETTKKEKGHGYGIKSIKETAKKYNGEVDFSIDNSIFLVQVYLYCKE